MTKRRSFSDKFKTTVELEVLCGDKTAHRSGQAKIHPTQVMTRKRQAIDGLTGRLSDNAGKAEDNEAEFKELHAKIRTLYTCANCRTAFKPNASSSAGSDFITLSGHMPRYINELPTAYNLTRYRWAKRHEN